MASLIYTHKRSSACDMRHPVTGSRETFHFDGERVAKFFLHSSQSNLNAFKA